MRRGQIQFGETIMVVVVIVFILIVGMVFYFKANEDSYAKTVRNQEDVAMVKLGKSILSMPEVQCTAFDGRGGCIDLLKFERLACMNGMGGCTADEDVRAYYSNLFGDARIEMVVLPVGGSDALILPLYESVPEASTLENPQIIFASLYDPATGLQRFGYLNVTMYRREVVFQ